MIRHNPKEFAAGLSAKLATRSRHVCMLLGAGAARACGLPDIAALQTQVKEELKAGQKEAFARQLEGRNLEQVLSRLRRIAELVTGTDTVDGLDAGQARALDSAVCQAIVKALSIAGKEITPMSHLAAWAARADYHQPLELFTINYDLLIETALEALGVPYFDGFVGNLKAPFRTELVEASPATERYMPKQFVRLWKLHGSVNWIRSSDQIVRIGQPASADLAAAIYPSDAKYEESRRVPFVVLQDRLRRGLDQPETLMLISGFSFSDAHLNEMLFDAATRRERSEFVVFFYGDIPDNLAQRAVSTPNMQIIGTEEAVIGGLRGQWNPPPQEDVPNIWLEGNLVLPDFAHLASYLARSSTRDGDIPCKKEDNIDTIGMQGKDDA